MLLVLSYISHKEVQVVGNRRFQLGAGWQPNLHIVLELKVWRSWVGTMHRRCETVMLGSEPSLGLRLVNSSWDITGKNMSTSNPKKKGEISEKNDWRRSIIRWRQGRPTSETAYLKKRAKVSQLWSTNFDSEKFHLTTQQKLSSPSSCPEIWPDWQVVELKSSLRKLNTSGIHVGSVVTAQGSELGVPKEQKMATKKTWSFQVFPSGFWCLVFPLRWDYVLLSTVLSSKASLQEVPGMVTFHSKLSCERLFFCTAKVKKNTWL